VDVILTENIVVFPDADTGPDCEALGTAHVFAELARQYPATWRASCGAPPRTWRSRRCPRPTSLTDYQRWGSRRGPIASVRTY